MIRRNRQGELPFEIIKEIIAVHFPGASRDDFIIIPPIVGKYIIFQRSTVLDDSSGENIKVLLVEKIAPRRCVIGIVTNPPAFTRWYMKRIIRIIDKSDGDE